MRFSTVLIICHCDDCKKAKSSAGVVAPQGNVKIECPVKTYVGPSAAGNAALFFVVTHIFCSNCGSPIPEQSPAVGEGQAVPSGLFPDFTDVPIAAECDRDGQWSRWAVVPAIKDAAQMSTMPT
ncbi:hypothetical protein C8R43DRAFT_1057531 [Mycena crocata]|nr:hypothetical protein C8R43DRAFT_1057531 [Mycena crocata]